MDHRLIEGLMEAVVPLICDHVDELVAAATAPLLLRIADLESRKAEKVEPDHDLILRLVEETSAKNPGPAGRDGKDADPAAVAELVDKAVAALPPAKDGAPGAAGDPGKDADPGKVAEALSEKMGAIISDEVRKTLEVWPIPPGPAGEPGKSVTIDEVRPLLEELVAQIPPAAAGKDADPVEVAGLILEDVAKLIPVPADGKSVTVEDLSTLVDEVVLRRVAELPKAKDGADGAPSRDGRDGLPGLQGEKGIDGRDGINGRDGFGIDDFDVKTSDDGRTIDFSFAREGVEPIVKQVSTGAVLDRGVWREQGYAKGDGVTWGGSFFIAQKATEATDKPGASDGWRLSIKKGRDGRDGKDGKDGLHGKDGTPGKDGRNGY